MVYHRAAAGSVSAAASERVEGMRVSYDTEGESIIQARACARILHEGEGAVVHKLQAALARVCVEYAQRKCGWLMNKRVMEEFLDRMKNDIAAKDVEIRKELNG